MPGRMLLRFKASVQSAAPLPPYRPGMWRAARAGHPSGSYAAMLETSFELVCAGGGVVKKRHF